MSSLAASEQRYRTLLESATDFIAVLTPDGIVREMNHRWVEFTGLPEAQLIGRHVRDFAPSDKEEESVQVYNDAIAARALRTPSVEIARPDGSSAFIQFSSTNVDIANERLVLTIGRDVTERTRAEEALWTNQRLLQESEDRLRLATDSTEVGVFDFLPRNGRLTWSEFTKRHFGIRSDVEVTYELFLTGLHPDDRGRVDGVVREALRGEGGGQYATEYRTIGIEDGQERHIAARGRVFFDGKNRATRLVGTTVDITERKRGEDAAREVARQKDEFLAMLAHELRNPLAPIRSALSLLERQPGRDPTGDRAISVIQRQVVHLVRLVDDLLDVSRTMLNKIQLRIQRVTLDKVMDEAVEAVAPLATAAGHTLDIRRPTPPVWLDADPARLVQIFSNLMHNAIKFTPPNGHVSVSVEQHDNTATIRVVDDGVGFAEEFQPHIFEMYCQEDRSLERAKGGLGVGLALAKALVVMHGGRIEARSAGRDLGSEFAVTLPTVSRLHECEGQVSGVAAVEAAGRLLRVLVVDDNVDGATMLQAFVSSLGHETAIAFDGPSGFAQAKAFRPDLILLDIGLPGMNGYEVTCAVRKEPALIDVYVAAVTGWGTEDDKRRARDAGFDIHLTKPVDLDVIENLTATLAHTVNCHGCDRCVETVSRLC